MNEVLNKEYTADVKSLFNIVTHSIYKDREIFIRELISNASDACEKLLFGSSENNQQAVNRSDLKIVVTIDKKNNHLIIQDNGIGMDEQDMINNLGTIANSGTKAFIAQCEKNDGSMIGQFGIGFYSSFLVANHVTVISKKFNSEKTYRWQSSGMEGFVISELENCDDENFKHGTQIILDIKADAEEYLDKHKIRHLIESYSKNINFDIAFYEVNEEDVKAEEEILNSEKALWLKNKHEITSEEYSKFYRESGGIYGDPHITLHNKVEGQNSYSYLLFVPATKPFSLFDPDRKVSVKLHVNRVFITDTADLLPRYLRFVKGIVDSNDLPLNVSREVVQTSHLITQMKQYLTKKVISELRLTANNKPEEYKNIFWQNFGAVLKEGLCEALNTEQRESMMEICKFYTSKSQYDPISLDEYISKMGENQKEIFYLNGDNIDKMMRSPEIEGFIKRDIEVILMTDSVDDFWINVVMDYKDKKFKSIAQSDICLDDIKANELTDEEKQNEINEEQISKLITCFKEVLGESVQDVIASKKLTESPACLGLKAGQMNMKMEKFLIDQKQLASRTQKTLEINPHHPLIKKMNDLYECDGSNEKLNDAIKNLFDFACIIADEPLANSMDFSFRATKIINNIL